MTNFTSLPKRLAKAGLEALRRRQRLGEIRATQPVVTRAKLVADLRGLGLVPGDIVFVHSSLKSLGYVEGGPRAVWEALLEVVSPAGTVIVPTYYMSGGTIYSTCQDKDYCFDPRRHGTGLGALPAAFLELPEVKRSIHPTHSVSAIGKHAGYVTEAHHLAPSIFGRGSPWQRCHELDGKVLGLGISMGPVTFYHLLEDSVLDAFPLPVRMRETFRLRCLDWDGQPLEVPVAPLDPAFMTRRIDHKSRDDLREYFWRDFELAGLLQAGRVGESRSWFVGSRRFYSHLLALMNEGITIYTLPEELAARPPGGRPRGSEEP